MGRKYTGALQVLPLHTIHTVHGVLKARILKWFAIPFSSGPHSVRPLHHDVSIVGGPTWHGLVSLSQTSCGSCDQTGQLSVIVVSGTRNQTANICWIIKKAREFQKNIYLCFIDYAKAFDCVDHYKLWKILKEMGIPDHLTCLLRNLYAGQEETELDMEQQTGSKKEKE